MTFVPGRTVLFSAWPQFDPGEVTFWQALHAALRSHDLDLVLTSTSRPPANLGVSHIPAVPTIDAYWPAQPSGTKLTETLKLDVEALLTREAAWGAPSILPSIERYRREAIEGVAAHWLHTLLVLRPATVVIWNGQHVSELVLEAASRLCGIPVLYVERAPVPQALFADERGLSAASCLAMEVAWAVPEARWSETAAAVAGRMAAGGQTWWEQPPSRDASPVALRRQLGVPDESRVLLFAGQVDEDTQQFLFSPHFDSNLSAFRWFLDQVRGEERVFVLGKQHPRSRTAAERYVEALERSGVEGSWRSDVSIDDALAVADRVAAVNSTVLYEALARGRPVLSLGKWLLSGRGAAYEVDNPADATPIVESWMEAGDHAVRQGVWLESLAFLLSRSVYAYRPDGDAAGMMGARELAARISDMAQRTRVESSLSPALGAWLSATGDAVPGWRVPGDDPAYESGLWQRAHAFRHQLIGLRDKAAAGRPIMIWGAGRAGQLAHEALRGMGVGVAAFVSSRPGPAQLEGVPVIGPHALGEASPSGMIAVASLASGEICRTLAELGFRPEEDYVVLDCDALVASLPATTNRGRQPRRSLPSYGAGPSPMRTARHHARAGR